tara:strand:+ start:8449 stop:9150 length:702 start_codon:yes stop_codon:yes gene_type:complete
MCTVTFIAKRNDDFILTSNRDEIPDRKTLSPQEYIEENVKLVYPKDQVAGGTWIGVSDRNRVINLLNGGFEPHKRKDYYRMSRGVVVKQLLTAEDAVLKIKEFDFMDIEPFTIILVDWNSSLKLYRLVWDGVKKHFIKLNLGNHIWSSSPLYSPEMKAKRQQWLSEFIENNVTSAESLLEFHHNAGEGNMEIDLQMNRGFIKTVSITQIEKKNNQVKMTYKDLNSGESNRIEI